MLDRSIGEAARQRYGLLTRAELDDLELSDHARRVRIESGALERINGKVVAVSGAPRTWRQRAAAAVMAVDGSALSHESSARLLGVRWYRTHDPITITAPLVAHHDLPGVLIRRSGRLPSEHITETAGIRHTTLARTLIDLAIICGDARLQELIEIEHSAGRVSWTELESTFHASCGRGRPGMARARRVLQRIEGKPPTESKLERMYLDLLRTAAVPLPQMQVTAPWADRQPGRVDGMFVEAKSIIELDGRPFHVRNAAFENDRLRDQLAVVRGYATTRFTYKQITGDPDHVVAVSRYLQART